MGRATVRAWVAAVVCGGALIVTGCEPAADPVQTHVQSGQRATMQAWRILDQSVQVADRATTYQALYHVHVRRSGADYWWWGKTKVQKPDHMSVYIDSAYVPFAYFQSGATAYVHNEPLWHKTQALSSIDLFSSYEQLVQRAEGQHLAIQRLPRKFVGNEYCQVYRAVIPGQWLKPMPSWENYRIEGATGDTSITFYVGNQSHRLRYVETVNASTASQMGPSEVDTNIEFSGFDAPTSKVTPPPSLARQLGRQIP